MDAPSYRPHATKRPPRLAVEVWGNDHRQLDDTARAAEELGFEALYYGESPTPLNLETATVLASLAERTTALRIGPVITNVLPAYRSFPLFVRQVHALAVISGGRLDVRTGTGAASTWARPWWEPVGVEYPDRKARRLLLEEWMCAFHHLWSHPGEPFAGRHVRFDELRLDPPVDRPPVTVAAVGPESMRIAARHADVWEASYLTPPQFEAVAARFDALAADRRPRVLRSLEIDAVTAPTPSARKRLEERFLAERGPAGRAALAKALTGPPADVAEQLTAYVAAGADQLLLAPADPHDASILEAVAEAATRL
jgi:alkanesulfonate monooxygenase SsuD/methylene tetrahydromethanopterin reductase-like flavin-dependent oxidoreductase (luciferase family)